MDLNLVKTLIIKEGRVKKILKGDTVIWNKIPFSVEITNDPEQTITGFKYMLDGSFTFAVNYHVPKIEQNETPTWTISGLPDGLSAEDLNANNLTVSGCTEHSGDHTVTVSVTKGSYSDTKTYTLNVDYGILITTPNKNHITDVALNQQASKTFESKFNVPEEEQDSPVEWSFENLPDGLSAEGGTVSGTATSLGNKTVTITVTKGSYSDTKTFTFAVYGLIVSTSSLPNGQERVNYSTTLGVTRHLPSGVGSLVYSASNLPSGLGLNASTGVISGTPTAGGTKSVSVWAAQSPYTSAAKIFDLSIAPSPKFNNSCAVYSLSAADMKDKNKVGTVLLTGDIYGVNFFNGQLGARGDHINSPGYDGVSRNLTGFFIKLSGDGHNHSQPVISVSTQIISDTQIHFTVKLNIRLWVLLLKLN